VRGLRQFAENDSQVASAPNDRDARQQYLHVADLDALQLLTRTKPHDLSFGLVQPQSAGCHPVVDVVNASGEALHGCM